MERKRFGPWKIILLIVGILASVIILAGLAIYAMIGIGISSNYDDIERGDDGFEYLVRYHNERNLKAGICRYTYDLNSGINEITIPETYGDYPVKSLGGYIGRGAPCHFSIEVKGFRTNRGVDPDRAAEFGVDHLFCYDLVMNIGANIREVFAYRSCYSSGNIGYVVRLYVNCDPDNPKYYSENGRLYTKSGELVEDLIYWDEVFD